MQSHLESGCEQCRGDLAAWARISDLSVRETAYEPPVAAVKMAKAAIGLHGPLADSPVAKLLFDSLSAPALVGVRSAEKRGRQVLYGFDDYRVDLRFEPNLDSDQALLVGQILSAESIGQNLGRITVSLVRGEHVLGTAKANEFGEFQLECDLGGRLELQLTLPDGARLRVPMVEPAVSEEKTAGLRAVANTRLMARKHAKKKSTRK